MFRERKSWIVLIAVLLVFAACKGETPTAPPPGSGTPGGGTIPPTGVSIALAASNTTPLVDSIVTITATVSQNNAPVPDGTAVEFTVSEGGVISGGGTSGTSLLRTTVGGIATVTLTSTTVRTVRVTATVNNVSRTVDVAFQARPVVPQPPSTAPTITSVTPSIGRPAGGQIIRITGANFRGTVRVLFDTGGPLPVEGSVVSVSADGTQIEVVTPPVNLGAGQQLAADIIVITQAGSATEQRVESTGAFTFRNEALTPVISTVTPNSGPVMGGTRVTIIGEGFQEPVQVLFNTAEARVLTVTFNQILVETPAARDTDPNGSGVVTGPVAVTVRNIASNTSVAMSDAFHYKAAMQITAVFVTALPDGGSRLSIEGIGFVSPVIAVVRTAEGDVGIQLLSVSGTRLVGTVPRLIPDSCGQDIEGPIVVTNVGNGDQAEGPTFTFSTFSPTITNVTPTTVNEGGSIFVTVADAIPGQNRFVLEGKTVFATTSTTNTDGTVTFTVVVPTNLEFETDPCGVGGEQNAPLDIDIAYSPSAPTGCAGASITDAVTVNPLDTTCRNQTPEPDAEVAFTANGAGCLQPAATTVAGPATTATITFTNTGTAPLLVTAGAITGTDAADFQVTPPTRTIAPGQVTNNTFTVTFDPSVAGAKNATVTFTTNDPDPGEATFTICLQGTANP